MWKAFVTKLKPVTVSLNAQFQELFTSNDLSTLKTKGVAGETYQMILEITTTCPSKVEIGFSDHGEWLRSYSPGNAEKAIIKVTGEWKETSSLKLETRTVCSGKFLTVHRVQFVKGTENCLKGIILITLSRITRINRNSDIFFIYFIDY